MCLVNIFHIQSEKNKRQCWISHVFQCKNCAFFAHLGAAFLTPDSEAPPTMTSDPRPLGELLHAALMSKKYLGQSSGNIGETPAYKGLGNWPK